MSTVRRTGLHVSIAGGLHLSLQRASALGCTTMQIFSHNPRGWKAAEISGEEAREFRLLRTQLDISPVIIHTSYLLNVASPKEELREKSLAMLRHEMQRADLLGADYIVLHTGTAHDDEGLQRAASAIRKAIASADEFSAGLLLENTSGKRGDTTSAIGDLARLLQMCEGSAAGVCIDSCHAYAAGYDLATVEGLRLLTSEVRTLLPAGAVRLLHLNDSKGAMGSGTDRHEHIGQGNIGAEGLRGFVRAAEFSNAAIILETPRESDEDDLRNLAEARKFF